MKKKLLCLMLGLILTFSAITVMAGENPSTDLLGVYNKRPDLQNAFPEVKNKDYGKLVAWAKKYGYKEDLSLVGYNPEYSKFAQFVDMKISNMYTAFQLELEERLASINTKNVVGVAGTQGIGGDKGIQGIKGDKGDTGMQGIKGDIGIQGIRGDKGESGIQGIKGDTGIQGIKGDKGEPGMRGKDGSNGRDLSSLCHVRCCYDYQYYKNVISDDIFSFYCGKDSTWTERYNKEYKTNIARPPTDKEILPLCPNYFYSVREAEIGEQWLLNCPDWFYSQ